MSSLPAAINSRRVNRILPWIGFAILLAGVIVFFVARHGNSTSAPSKDLAAGKVNQFGELKTGNQQKQIEAANRKLEQPARVVAGKFILTAVQRKNLAEARKYSSPTILGSVTKAEWMKGNLPVVPYPYKLQNVSLKVDQANSHYALIEVALIPKSNTVKGMIFWIELKKYGKGKAAHWLVESWVPRSGAIIPTVS
jgi:hypothetical protein